MYPKRKLLTSQNRAQEREAQREVLLLKQWAIRGKGAVPALRFLLVLSNRKLGGGDTGRRGAETCQPGSHRAGPATSAGTGHPLRASLHLLESILPHLFLPPHSSFHLPCSSSSLFHRVLQPPSPQGAPRCEPTVLRQQLLWVLAFCPHSPEGWAQQEQCMYALPSLGQPSVLLSMGVGSTTAQGHATSLRRSAFSVAICRPLF